MSCPICLDNLEDNQVYKLQECDCVFHTQCILGWFRQSNNKTCPTCRNHGVKNENVYVNYRDVNSHILSLARRFAHKNPDHDINKLFEVLKKEEMIKKDIRNKINTLRNSTGLYKDIDQQIMLLKRRQFKKDCKINSLKKNIISIYPVTNIILITKKETNKNA